MKDIKKLFLEFNMWLVKNMSKFILWVVMFGITSDAFYYYRISHTTSTIAYTVITLFLGYAEWKIIFR